jgi:hypothetical protein
MSTLNPILEGIARRLGCGQTWNEVVVAIDAIIKQRDDLKIDAERFRTSFYKLRRKNEAASRQLKDEELSEAVENSGGFGVVGTLEVDKDDLEKVLDAYILKTEIPPLTSPVERIVKEFVGSLECPECSRVIGLGTCPSCHPIEFVAESVESALEDAKAPQASEETRRLMVKAQGMAKTVTVTLCERGEDTKPRQVRRFWSGNAWIEE